MTGIIYKTTNLINKKIYIGSDIKNNGNGDPAYLGSGILLKKSIKKYGIENFSKEIIFFCESLDELKNKESEMIKFYKSNQRDIGYNISDGYWGGDTLTSHPEIESIKRKISSNIPKNLSSIIKDYYSKEDPIKREKRIERVKEGMINYDKSFISTPEYRKNLSDGIRKSIKFNEYNLERKGKKRGKYQTNPDVYNSSRNKNIEQLQNSNLRKILSGLVNKDHSTFYCYFKVYSHIEKNIKIEGLDNFLNYLEEKIYSGNLTLRDAKREYKEIGLDKIRLGKSTTVIKSVYTFKTKNYPNVIIDPVKNY
jgi:hypothetical protein